MITRRSCVSFSAVIPSHLLSLANPFEGHIYEWCLRNPFRICSYKTPRKSIKTNDFKSYRMRSYKRVPRKSFRMRSSKNHGGLGREWSSKGLHPVRMRTPRKVVTRGLFSCLTGAWAADERSAPLTSHSSAVQSSSPVVHCYPRAMVLFGAGDSGHTLACYLKGD